MKRFLVLFAVFATLLSPAVAVPTTVHCHFVDTSTTVTTPVMALDSCVVTTGADGILYVVVTTQTACIGTEGLRAFIVAGTAPAQTGSAPLASIASGMMMVAGPNQSIANFEAGIGGFTTPYNIQVGQIVTGLGNNPINVPITITGQTSSSENGIKRNDITAASWAAGQVTFTTTTAHNVPVAHSFTIAGMAPPGYNGTYTSIVGTTGSTLVASLVSDPGVSTGFGVLVGDLCGTLAAGAFGGCGLYTVSDMSFNSSGVGEYFTLNPVPGGTIYLQPTLHQNACNSGFTVTTFVGSFTGASNTAYWLALVLSTDALGNFTSSTNIAISVVEY